MKLTRAAPPPPPPADFVLTLTPDEKASLTALVGSTPTTDFSVQLYDLLTGVR